MFNTYIAMYGLTEPSALTVNIIKNISNSSVVVQWDAVDDSLPITYTVTWTDEKDDNGVATVEEQTSYTITGLTRDTVYTISVTAANRCGSGPEFRTSISLSTDTTSTTSSISPTVTASTNPMTVISTVNPSSSSNPSTTTMVNPTTNSITTTLNGNADISTSRNPDTTMTTIFTNLSITITTNIVISSTNIANTPTTDETSKFSTYIVNMHTVYHNEYSYVAHQGAWLCFYNNYVVLQVCKIECIPACT